MFFHLSLNILWISLNKLPFAWDEAGHAIIAFRFTDFFKGGGGNFLSISDYYPPFVHLLTAFLMLIFGKNITLGPLVVTGFFIISIVFLYLYTSELFKKELFQSRLMGILAATLFSFLPNIYSLSRQFLLEIPLLSMILGSLFFLEKSENFKNRKFTYLFALLFALALAIKWTAIIFLFVPIIFKLFKAPFALIWKNLLLGLGIILGLNLPWYLHNLPVILHAASFTTTAEAADPQKILSLQNFEFYPFSITNFQLTWFGMIIFLTSAVYFLFKKSSYLLITYLFVYLVLTLIGNKDLRYIVFLAPIASMIIAWFLVSLKDKVWAKVLGVVLFSYYIFYYFSLSFGIFVNPVQADFRRSVEVPYFGWIDLINLGKDTSGYLAPMVNMTVWPNSLIVSELSKHHPEKDIKILIICEKPFLNQVNMELSRRQLDLNKLQFFAPYDLVPFADEKLLEKYLLSYDLILVANKDLGLEGGIRYFAILKQLAGFIEEGKSTNLVKINNYFLPDGDRLDVYKPRIDPI